jgi:hypothetical protein
MHPLQIVAMLVLATIFIPILAIGALGFIMFLLPDAIAYKGETSRLLRIEEAIRLLPERSKHLCHEVKDFFDILTNRRRLHEVMDEIVTGQRKLPF